MNNQIKEKLSNLPEEPGIYKMLDANGTIIYIGKSKCLKKRVRSYFTASPKWEKAKKMALFIHDVEIIVTDTHLEAMLLECELIKKENPYFNIIMKNDKKFVYLKIKKSRTLNPLEIVYEKGEDCFGPFRSRSRLQNVIDSMRKMYPIRKIKNNFEFDYHPLPISMNEDLFQENRIVLLDFCFKIKSLERFTKTLKKKMKTASDNYLFETATMYRDIITNITYLKNGLYAYSNWFETMLLLTLEIKKGCKLFLILHGQVIHKDILPFVTEEEKSKFLIKAKEKLKYMPISNDKASIDYSTIIYSELAALPSEMMEIIEKL